MRVLKTTLHRVDIASRRHCAEILPSFLNPRCAQRWLGPNLSTREKKRTQKAPARFRPCHTAEQYSSEFKLIGRAKRPKTPQQKSHFQVEQGRSDFGRCQYRSPHGQCVRLTEWEYDDNFSGCEGIFFEKGGAQRWHL